MNNVFEVELDNNKLNLLHKVRCVGFTQYEGVNVFLFENDVMANAAYHLLDNQIDGFWWTLKQAKQHVNFPAYLDFRYKEMREINTRNKVNISYAK